MTIEILHERGVSNRAIARQLGVTEHTVRYRLGRQATGAVDGRSGRPVSAEPWAESIGVWMRGETARGLNLQALYEWLVAEHDYAGATRRSRASCARVT